MKTRSATASARRRGERGQLLPVWALGVVTTLALLLFVVNYANIVRWQIRAQNAADAAAGASTAPLADGWNEIELELYGATIDELRIRYLNQAILNTLNSNLGTTVCPNPTACTNDYNNLVTELNLAVGQYDATENFLVNIGSMVNDRYLDPSNGAYETVTGGAVPNITGWQDDTTCTKIQGSPGYSHQDGSYSGSGSQPTPGPGHPGWSSTGCASQTDTAFLYTPMDIDGTNIGYGAPGIGEVVSCRDVPLIQPKLFGLSTGANFRAVGVSAFTISPILSIFQPGVSVNPATGNVYQPVEKNATSADQSTYTNVDFSGLTVNANFYVPVPTQPYRTFNPFGTSTSTHLSQPNGPVACASASP